MLVTPCAPPRAPPSPQPSPACAPKNSQQNNGGGEELCGAREGRGVAPRVGGAPWGCGAVQGGAVGGNVVCCGYAAANYRSVKSSNSVPITF